MCNKTQGFYQSQVEAQTVPRQSERVAIIAEILQMNARLTEDESGCIDLACAIETALFPNNERGYGHADKVKSETKKQCFNEAHEHAQKLANEKARRDAAND